MSLTEFPLGGCHVIAAVCFSTASASLTPLPLHRNKNQDWFHWKMSPAKEAWPNVHEYGGAHSSFFIQAIDEKIITDEHTQIWNDAKLATCLRCVAGLAWYCHHHSFATNASIAVVLAGLAPSFFAENSDNGVHCPLFQVDILILASAVLRLN